MSLQIRVPQSSDKQQWLALWQGYLEFYKEQLPQEITDITWERMLDVDEKMYGFVAFDGDVIIGFVNYIFHRSTWAKGYYCYLEDLYVADEVRGKGVAKALIQAVRKVANENNCERLYWVTGESNTVAKALYDKIAEKTEYFQYRLSLD